MSQGNIEIILTLIATVGGIITTYIIYIAAKRRKLAKPKDRMETIFDGYEKLISQQQIEIERKGSVINSLENVVDRLEEELAHTRELLNGARADLSESREQNEELKSQLIAMRKDYSGASS